MPKFSKVLVANRGEIACRVITGAQAAGYPTVAVYSDADAKARHVQLADQAVRIGPPPVGESYLKIDTIIEAAKASGADAIHPGYGFLAENADFSQACTDAGIVFIGPSPDAITLMGNKRQSKIKMLDAGVPCVPGYEGADQDNDTLVAESKQIGVPVMIKAAAGGGGRGMRLCDDEAKLGEMIDSARSEAQNAFGSGELILEKAVVGARHVEIQVFGDEHGTVVHLGERDCSVQRRNQKIVEESPSPVVDEDLRTRMGEAAVDAAQSINYVGAGTVEFLLAADGAFYFLEMNTRLQVEHPVTELVTGVDLVDWQLRIAQGQPIPMAQADIKQTGHAIEVRLCAEDPGAGYMPQTGRVIDWTPATGVGVRIDHGLLETAQGGATEISPFYDSMVAKVIAYGHDRESARGRLLRALADTRFHGVLSNQNLLTDILAEADFAAGDFNTGYMPAHFPEQALADAAPSAQAWLLAALALHQHAAGALSQAAGLPAELMHWQSAPGGAASYVLESGEAKREITLAPDPDGGFELAFDGADDAPSEPLRVDVLHAADGALRLSVDGVTQSLTYSVAGDALWLDLVDSGAQRVWQFLDKTLAPAAGAAPGADGKIAARSDGRLLAVRVAEGDAVEAGQTVAVLEAMKMEFQLQTPVAGTVSAVHASEGQQVSNRQLLVEIEVAEPADAA